MPTSGTPARASGIEMRPVPRAELQQRAAGIAARRCARTARRGARACGRSPSRRTGRTRPSPRGPRPRAAAALGCGTSGGRRLLANGGEEHRVLDFDEGRAGQRGFAPIGVERREEGRAGVAARRSGDGAAIAASTRARRRVHTSSGGAPSCTLRHREHAHVHGFDAAGVEQARHARTDRRVRHVVARLGDAPRRSGCAACSASAARRAPS